MNINIELKKNFINAYNKMQNDYGEEMAKINGFSAGQLSYTDFIDNFIDSDTVADASVDGNANVGQKDIVTPINEMPKPHQKLLAFNKIHYEINKKYGFKTANDWLRNEWDGHLYLHDANTSTFVHYCFAYDLKDLAEKGLFFIENFNAEPPQHLKLLWTLLRNLLVGLVTAVLVLLVCPILSLICIISGRRIAPKICM